MIFSPNLPVSVKKLEETTGRRLAEQYGPPNHQPTEPAFTILYVPRSRGN